MFEEALGVLEEGLGSQYETRVQQDDGSEKRRVVKTLVHSVLSVELVLVREQVQDLEEHWEQHEQVQELVHEQVQELVRR